MTLGREAGRDEYHTAMALHHLGLLALECDRDSEAEWSLYERSLTMVRNIGDRRLAGNILVGWPVSHGRAATRPERARRSPRPLFPTALLVRWASRRT